MFFAFISDSILEFHFEDLIPKLFLEPIMIYSRQNMANLILNMVTVKYTLPRIYWRGELNKVKSQRDNACFKWFLCPLVSCVWPRETHAC